MISFLVEQKKCKWIAWNNWEEQNEKKLSPAHDVNQDYLTVMKKDEVFFLKKKKGEIIEEITWEKKTFFIYWESNFFPIHKRYIR